MIVVLKKRSKKSAAGHGDGATSVHLVVTGETYTLTARQSPKGKQEWPVQGFWMKIVDRKTSVLFPRGGRRDGWRPAQLWG
jgi:hypothetical protein